jgi:hypothetical protein
LDGTQTVPAGPYPIAAVQYANSAMSGGHYDLSIVHTVFGPGGGTIGGDMVYPRDPNTGAIYAVAVNPITARTEKHALTPAEWAVLGHTGPFADLSGTDLADLLALPDMVAATSGGGTEPPEPAEPKTITLDIPSVPGKATGTIS